MLVKDRMTKEVSTITPEASISKAFQVLMEKRHSQLPVVDENNKVVGLLTEKLLSEVSPSKATSLSVFEINYLLSKTKVREIMRTDIFTIHPDDLIEEAALVMYVNDIGSLPVIEKDRTLVGIVTRLDIFAAFIEIMGVNDKGTRISLKVKDERGTLADIAGIVKRYGMDINHISNYNHKDDKLSEIVLRLSTHEVDALLAELEEKGYTVLSVVKTD